MWKQYAGGRRWRVLPNGQYEVEGEGVIRSKGRPLTMLYLVRQFGKQIQAAADIAGVPREWIAAMITIEAERCRSRPLRRLWSQARLYVGSRWRGVFDSEREMERYHGLLFDPISIRKEPGFVSALMTPSRWSASLGQVLYSTALEQATRAGLTVTVTINEKTLDVSGGMCLVTDPQINLIVAALYMKHLQERYRAGVGGYEFDFVHLTGAYNAGSIKTDRSSEFRVLAYHKHRTRKALTFLNDALSDTVQEAWGVVNGD